MRNINPETDECFAGLYRRHYSPIFRFIFRLTGETAEAEDVTQDVFVKLYRCLHRDGVPAEPKAWLFKVSANTCYTLLKRNKRHRILMESPETFTTHFQPQRFSCPSAEDHTIQNDDIEKVRHAMARLAVQDRIILELHHSGLSYAEIADTLNIRSSTVGKKLFRVRQKLKKILTIRGELS